MSKADHIRDFIIGEIIAPAKAAGKSSLVIKAGDVHRRLGLGNAYPAVCSALRGRKLQFEAGIILTKQEGPPNGANVWYHFDLGGRERRPTAPPPATGIKSGHSRNDMPDLAGALVLVSCSKLKAPTSAPARELYCSTAFGLKRQIIERAGADWAILSAKHGLVDPATIIEPYDLTLVNMGAGQRRAWAQDVLATLISLATVFNRVIIFAGRDYSQYLIGPLREAGVEVCEPLRGLRQGQQLNWLAQWQ